MTGIELISKERSEQIEKHGYSLQMDSVLNTDYQLSYAATALLRFPRGGAPKGWDPIGWVKIAEKPYRERLIIAGALIAAELDRLGHKSK